MSPPAELVVLSHLRWDWVWQRPQHLMSRMSRGRRTWFVEEPQAADVGAPRLRHADAGPVTRVWLDVPAEPGHMAFSDPRAAGYAEAVVELLASRGRPIVWLYTPMALDIAQALQPELIVFDVMDDLASFKNAPAGLRLLQRRALAAARVVFTGGRTLHQTVVHHKPDATFLFPSGVEPEHYASARLHRQRRDRRVAGYVGAIDERLDLDLIAGLADALPDWDIHMVGPVAKIDEASLPHAPNLAYLGMQPYGRLPELMGGFDVALMPFALNDATRSISPTKTLEYLAAGLPVVSTRVADVVADYGDVVSLADDAGGFAGACRALAARGTVDTDPRVRSLLHLRHWDTIAARMEQLVAGALAEAAPAGEETA